MSNGDRLASERKRLKYNQEKFGAIGGVTRKTQSNYELDESHPDGKYLTCVSSAGVDVQYVLTGIRSINYLNIGVGENSPEYVVGEITQRDSETWLEMIAALNTKDQERLKEICLGLAEKNLPPEDDSGGSEKTTDESRSSATKFTKSSDNKYEGNHSLNNDPKRREKSERN